MQIDRTGIVQYLGLTLFAFMLAACGGGDGGSAPPTLVSIAINPGNPSVAKGMAQQFIATGVYSNSSTSDVTSSVTWSSSTPTVAAVSAVGLASTVGVGSTRVTANLGSVSTSTTLTVTTAILKSISLSPTTPSVALGLTQQFKATGVYSDSSTADLTTTAAWSSATASVAAVTAAGLATAIATGSSIIMATSGAISAHTTLTVTPPVLVSISITPSPAFIGIGLTLPESATGTYSNGTIQNLTGAAAWTSSTNTVASVGATTGAVTGASVGLTTITATVGTIAGTTSLSVLANQWGATGGMSVPREDHTATLLPNGDVLAAGGNTTGTASLTITASAETYSASAARWAATGSLNTPRFSHTATLLANGTVLVAGGVDATGATLASAELYNPVTGAWTATGSLSTPRSEHTATLLGNGKVLVVGGCCIAGINDYISSSEIYDPATGTWTVTGSLSTPVANHTATLLASGNVLVAGGTTVVPYGGITFLTQGVSTAEIYNAGLGTWTVTGSMTTARTAHTATLLSNGKVLVAGGLQLGNPISTPVTSAELYDPAAGTWNATGSLSIPRASHTATLLPNGKVLVAGSVPIPDAITVSYPPATSEIYDPVAATWTTTGSMTTGREFHTATLLSNGTVLVTGGDNGAFNSGGTASLSSSEIYFFNGTY